eukprot:PLAT12563.2.p1 GENE.PLAT12563.2~~PLAT12563.2.p1  ORF type:complete len:151 (-),score=22.99 PLAT12563.2:11-442(-)
MDALPTSPVSFLYTPPEEDGELGVIDMEISLDGGGPDDGAAAATSASEGGKREEAGGVPLVAMSDALVDKVELERMKSLQARIGTSLQSGCIQLKQFNECSEEMLTEAGVGACLCRFSALLRHAARSTGRVRLTSCRCACYRV